MKERRKGKMLAKDRKVKGYVRSGRKEKVYVGEGRSDCRGIIHIHLYRVAKSGGTNAGERLGDGLD